MRSRKRSRLQHCSKHVFQENCEAKGDLTKKENPEIRINPEKSQAYKIKLTQTQDYMTEEGNLRVLKEHSDTLPP